MAITAAFEDSATIGATEYSLTNDSTTLATQTTAGEFDVFLDLDAMADGDVYEVSIYEKVVSTGSQIKVATYPFANDQGADNAGSVIQGLKLLNGWDISVTKLSGTDRSIGWSIRYDDGKVNVTQVNSVEVGGVGTEADPWNPA